MLKLVNKEGREAFVEEGSSLHTKFIEEFGFEVKVEKKTRAKKTTVKSNEGEVSTKEKTYKKAESKGE